jgi:hypothetical protein
LAALFSFLHICCAVYVRSSLLARHASVHLLQFIGLSFAVDLSRRGALSKEKQASSRTALNRDEKLFKKFG